MIQSAWRVPRPTAQPEPPSLEGLLEPGVDALPVRITLVQDDATTGWDDGALGFEDDAVWYSGRAASFRLAAPDILPGTYRLSRHEAVTDGEALRQGLPLRHPTREVWVRIELLDVDGRKEWEDEIRLIREIKRLRALSEGGGQSQYPPLAPRPGLLNPSRNRRKLYSRPHHRLIGGTFGGIAFLVANVLLSRHLYEWPSIVLAGMGWSLLGLAIRGEDEPTKPERKVLQRIAAEEAGLLSSALTPPPAEGT